MQFIFTADLHLSSAFGNEDARLRNAELIDNFKKTIEYAKSRDIRLIVLGGDLFDTPYPTAEISAAVRGLINSNQQIQFLAVCGNHDPLYATEFYNNPPVNMYVFPERITKYEKDGIRIYGISEKSSVPTDGRWNSFEGEAPFITLYHGEPEFANLSDSKASLCLMGHIHKSEVHTLTSGAKAIYCGTPAGRGFDECGQKGFYVIDSETFRYEFIASDAKQYKEYEIDISAAQDVGELLNILSQVNVPENEIARAKLVGSLAKPFTIDCAQLCSLTAQFCEIKDQTELDIDIMSGIDDSTLEGEFVRILVQKMSKAKGEDKEKILAAIKAGILALRGN